MAPKDADRAVAIAAHARSCRTRSSPSSEPVSPLSPSKSEMRWPSSPAPMKALSGLSKKMRVADLHLMREIAAQRSLARHRIVRRADLRQLQQPRVVQRERRQNHRRRGLEEFLAARVGVLDAGGAAVLMNDAPHPASGPQLKVLVLGAEPASSVLVGCDFAPIMQPKR